MHETVDLPMQIELLNTRASDLGARLDHAIQRLHHHPFSPLFICSDVSFEMPRIFNDFSGDISGRYIELFALLGQLGRPTPDLENIVRRTLGHQQPEGYFGASGFSKSVIGDKETKIFWGNGRLLIGLLEYYRLTKAPDILEAARRMGEFFLDCGIHASTGSVGQAVDQDGGAAGFATTFCSCIEGVARLYEELGDPRFLEMARGMSDLLPENFDGFHSHGRLTALRGMLQLARGTQDAALRSRVVRQWEAIATDHVTCLGGLREHFGHSCDRDEACSVADWVMLSLQLFEATGEARYVDAAEHGLLNHLLTNQFANGGFGHHEFQLDKVAGQDFPLLSGIGRVGTEAYWCCSFHGPRALVECARHLAASPSPDQICINHYFPAQLAGRGCRFRLEADPYLRSAALTVLEAPAEPLTLRLRVPGWADDFSISVNARSGAQPVPAVRTTDQYMEVSRAWQTGDQIRVQLHPGLHVRAVTPLAEHAQTREKDALFLGPFLLGFENTDDLLWGQGMTGEVRSTILFVTSEPADRPPDGQAKIFVEYHSETLGRTIWATRLFVPVMDRPRDVPLRTSHAIEERPYSSLTAEQREEMVS